jgi:hypothetical protein
VRLVVAVDKNRGGKAQVAQADLAVGVHVNGCGLYRVVYMHGASQGRRRRLKERALTCFKACSCFRACTSIRATEGSSDAGTWPLLRNT